MFFFFFFFFYLQEIHQAVAAATAWTTAAMTQSCARRPLRVGAGEAAVNVMSVKYVSKFLISKFIFKPNSN